MGAYRIIVLPASKGAVGPVTAAVYEGAAAAAQLQTHARVTAADGTSSVGSSVANTSRPPYPSLSISQPAVAKTTNWYRRRAQMADMERYAKGESAKKRNNKIKEFYACGKCGQPKTKETGHTQYKGNWYCPNIPNQVSHEQWREAIMAKAKAKKDAKKRRGVGRVVGSCCWFLLFKFVYIWLLDLVVGSCG